VVFLTAAMQYAEAYSGSSIGCSVGYSRCSTGWHAKQPSWHVQVRLALLIDLRGRAIACSWVTQLIDGWL